jgi:TrmH family RNA methyltransferase
MNTKSHSHHAKEVIASRNHPAVKRIRNLHLRTERARTGLFYIEGIRFVAQAVERQVHIETLVHAPALLTNPFGQRLVRQQRRAGVPCLELAPEVLQSIALNDDPQGIGAVVRQRWEPLRHADPARCLC